MHEFIVVRVRPLIDCASADPAYHPSYIMCVGVKADETSLRRKDIEKGLLGVSGPKRRNDNERKEKAKNAARERRNQEGDYLEVINFPL